MERAFLTLLTVHWIQNLESTTLFQNSTNQAEPEMIPRFCRQVAFRLTTVCRKQEKRFVPEQQFK